jgi:2-oxoisovalerate dehydrogenase E2 component (dihydrolipoyl transacylase)
MAEHVIKLPDVGEGVAEAELVEWHVKPGDIVREDAVLAAVMTDKATVEIPSPVDGKVIWLGAEVGDTVPVGAPIVRLEVEGDVPAEAAAAEEPSAPAEAPEAAPAEQPRAAPPPVSAPEPPKPKPAPATSPTAFGAPRPEGERPLASPAVRLRAREAGIDLRQVPGTGPAGRITHEDIDGFLARGRAPAAPALARRTEVEEVKVTGLRRRIAERMALAKARIPHITYVEEVDVTELEELRARLNGEKRDRPRLTVLPFLMRAMVRAIEAQPKVNALFDDEAGVIRRHGAVHIGVATQTDAGLMVPVVRHAEARDLWDCAAELNRLAEAARTGIATREELSGSTITITSLGPMGGIVSTPVINHPEVAIVGVNKMAVRPVWNGQAFVPRKVMNLSSAFDHRVIDGWDAAVFVQRIKTLLETPAMIFLEG